MTIRRARQLRKSMPPAEAALWNMLRMEPFKAFHFRRQVPLGPYYADFASHAAELVIEADGDTHGFDAAIEHDRKRDACMREQGFRIVRIPNVEVRTNLEGVAEYLLHVLGEGPVGAQTAPSERER